MVVKWTEHRPWHDRPGDRAPSTAHQLRALGKWLNLSEPQSLKRNSHGHQLLGSNAMMCGRARHMAGMQ